MAQSGDARGLCNVVTLAHNYQLVPSTPGSTHSFAKIWLTWIKKTDPLLIFLWSRRPANVLNTSGSAYFP